MKDTITLFRPTGDNELALVAASGFRRWPPRLPEQPIFYPVTNEQYATEIARDWNVPASGVGHVTRFEVEKAFMDRYATHQVGATHHMEWWVPAEELETLNDHIVGTIEVVKTFRAEPPIDEHNNKNTSMNKLETQSYEAQAARWPSQGKHILAHHDQESVIVYQAYRESIGRYAAQHGRFGGPDFSFNRMSWIKPNFLWMMYRSGWATKAGQEVVLALRLSRRFFESLLERAVPSTFAPSMYPTVEAWQADVAVSDVRMQWDPDHAPDGSKLERRAIQLGLRGAALKAMAGDELLEVIDVSPFIAEQRQFIQSPAHYADLQTPIETVFEPQSTLACRRVLG